MQPQVVQEAQTVVGSDHVWVIHLHFTCPKILSAQVCIVGIEIGKTY